MSKSKFPLTNFICNMKKASNEQILKAKPDKMAAAYGIRERDARDYLRLEKEMRGILWDGKEENK